MNGLTSIIKNRMLRGASTLLVSQAVSICATFVRNVIIARYVGAENYGIAVTFGLAMSIVEMSGNLALTTLLVQDKRGDSNEMLASAHFTMFVKGLLLSLILYIVAKPIAAVFDLVHITWAFQLLAVVPAIRGASNLDLIVMQRRYDFLATAIADAVPQLVSVGMAFVLATWLGDYRAMLILIVFNTIFMTLITHLLAKRPYRWLISKKLIAKTITFGWPILLNGILIFLLLQGDRMIVGSMYDMTTLGIYSAAFSLALLPSLFFAKLSGMLLMPILSRTQDDPDSLEYYGTITLDACFSFGILFSAFFILGGQSLLLFCFGQTFAGGMEVVAWLGIMQSIRCIRMAPTCIANSQGWTRLPLIGNIFRVLSLPFAVWLASRGMSLAWLAYIGIVGEILAFIVLWRLLPLQQMKGRLESRVRFLVMLMFGSCSLALVSGLGTPATTPLGNFYNVLLAAFYSTAIAAGTLLFLRRGVTPPPRVVNLPE
ncbi:oligosaccharide flippase family protein [Biformimicrobium ophioploci]|uniref:Polysaccharide biosynthesis protein n=1 Tax=Biformimicrobium ophioploci TaxID=3036711 RepID=A0ABQ6M074_9GAMM|nr:oligosaccharide flippase family protein [Microbulbifer sp. NKW57]GMG87745.1 hypothetical protein MNKW57_20660 [Microbulbifer sp. NKW57]